MGMNSGDFIKMHIPQKTVAERNALPDGISHGLRKRKAQDAAE